MFNPNPQLANQKPCLLSWYFVVAKSLVWSILLDFWPNSGAVNIPNRTFFGILRCHIRLVWSRQGYFGSTTSTSTVATTKKQSSKKRGNFQHLQARSTWVWVPILHFRTVSLSQVVNESVRKKWENIVPILRILHGGEKIPILCSSGKTRDVVLATRT